MKIECVYTKLDECRDAIDIIVDGRTIIQIHDGENEDNYLFRNFSDCYNIAELISMAYNAGKNGDKLELIEIEKEGVEYD